MPEDQIDRLNLVIEKMFTRLDHDIATVPVEQMPHIAQALIIFVDYKNALQSSEGSANLQDKIYRMMIEKMKNGESFGINIIQPPDAPPFPGQPPQPPEPSGV